jgi:hypothetical protein
MDDTGTLKRRSDGSLDTDHYRGVAHQLRSAAVRRWLQDLMDVLHSRRANASTGRAAGDGRP